MNRVQLADIILTRLQAAASDLARQFSVPDCVASFQLLDVLPPDIARRIHGAFPASDRMVLKRSIKENKHVAAQMDQYDPILEEAVYAFQDPRVVELVGQITGLKSLEPDVNLYAGGISAMQTGAYLRPHLDNSHDAKRERYRVLNLLYYVTPDWTEADGGSLQLWDHGPKGSPRTISSTFNSLVVMLTNKQSWHSVSEVTGDGRRCCISNYFFSNVSPEAADYFHATSFRSEYGKGLADAAMRVDNALRTAALKSVYGKVWQNPHAYRRDNGER